MHELLKTLRKHHGYKKKKKKRKKPELQCAVDATELMSRKNAFARVG
jgi:hypothetical protein